MWTRYFFWLLFSSSMGQDCQLRDYGKGGHVCVCDSSYCDIVPSLESMEPLSHPIYTSNKAGLRFHKTQGSFTQSETLSDNQIHVNPSEEYQEILGWGGAFTDSTGINIDSLDQTARDNLLKSYFSEDGIEYSLCRVPMGGTDFSERAYSYDDQEEEDPELVNFKLTLEDFKYKIPLIKEVQNLTKNNLRLFASVWTAPKWIKTNEEQGDVGVIRENLYQTWAEYFIKFLDKYKDEGIEFWGITTQNEPSLVLAPGNRINTVPWTPKMISTWISNNLGPTIRASNYSNIKIMAIDDQRIILPFYTNIFLQDDSVLSYIDGIALHWYWNYYAPPILLNVLHNALPDKFLLSTEACHISGPIRAPVQLGSWERGEAYADDIIDDVLNWVTGWVDWNMVLDLNGGPTYIKNFVDAPIIVNATAGEFYKQPMFYALGHFSKFVPRGSIRIGVKTSITDVKVAAFRRPDGDKVLVILNKGESVIPVTIIDKFKGSTSSNLSEKSITTIVYRSGGTVGNLSSKANHVVPHHAHLLFVILIVILY